MEETFFVKIQWFFDFSSSSTTFTVVTNLFLQFLHFQPLESAALSLSRWAHNNHVNTKIYVYIYIYTCAAHWAAATTNKKTVQIFAHFRLDGLNRLAFYGFSFMVSQLHGVSVSLRTCKDVVWKTVCHASPMYLCGSMSRFCNPMNKFLTH